MNKATLCLSVALIAQLFGCAQSGNEPTPARAVVPKSSHGSEIPYERVAPNATVEIDVEFMNRALSGDGSAALQIASRFSDVRDFVKAQYWLHIAAENGNGIAMQRLSVLMRDMDCTRANFWLEHALESGDLKGASREANRTDLQEYREACRHPKSD